MIEHHPYGEFIPENAESMIIGSFPIGKFTNPHRRAEIKPNEFDFFFGGEKNLLWRLLAACFNVEIKNRDDIVQMLKHKKIGVGDLIQSCRRKEGSASDADLYDIRWNHTLLNKLKTHNINTLYFTSRKVAGWFDKLFPQSDDFKKITLLSPSAQSIRSLYHHPNYEKWKLTHPDKRGQDFLLEQYKKVFK